MLEFLTGLFIILLSVFFLFISSNKKIEEKKNITAHTDIKLDNSVKKDNPIIADITDWEKNSWKINQNIIQKQETEVNNSETSLEWQKNNFQNKEKNLEQEKIIKGKIEFRKQEMMTKLGFIEESYLNIEKKSDNDFEVFMVKAIKLKKELEEKKQKQEEARKQALLEQEKAKQEQIKKELEEKKNKTIEENKEEIEGNKENNNNNNIDFSKYISLKKSNKTSMQVFIYKDWKVEEKWISRNLSPIKQTISLVLKNSWTNLKSLVLKNGVLTIKLNNKVNEKLRDELTKTAKFFPQVNNVIIK